MGLDGRDNALKNTTADEGGNALENTSLKMAGRAFLVADASLMASGMMSGRYREAAGGLLWAGGAAVLARYGNENQERHLQNLSLHLSEYLAKEGVDLPERGQISREMIAKNDGLIHKIEDFLYKHPSEVANAIYTYGGLQLLRSGITHNKRWDSVSGAAVTAGALAGLLIPQSKEKLPRTGNPITDSWNAIREKPLRLTGSLYMISPVALFTSGIKEYRANPADKSYLFKLLAASSNLVANCLITMSSKNTDPSTDDKDMRSIYEGAASIIAAQPKEVRQSVVEHIASFISTQPETSVTTKQAKTILNQSMDEFLAGTKQGELPTHITSWQERTHPSNADSLDLGLL